MLNLEQQLSAAVDAAHAAGALVRENWGKSHQLEFKGEINLVTETDRASEALILQHLRTAAPGYDILTEETGAHGSGAAFRWVIDPVDGTTNYAHHFPYFTVSIGLEENGVSVAGVIYDPIGDQTFTATRGGGAYLNGKPIHASATDAVGHSLLASGLAYDVWESDRGIAQIVSMFKHARSVRINGSAALDMAYVACGRLDAYCDTGLSPWDISAARLILQEAGGRFALYGDPSDLNAQYLIASNGVLHAELERLLLS